MCTSKCKAKILFLFSCALYFLFFTTSSFAEHIQYVDIAWDFDPSNTSASTVSFNQDGDEWTYDFDLTVDQSYLWTIPEGTANAYNPNDGMPDVATAETRGTFNPADTLHYAYLRIDPNNVNLDGQASSEPTATYLTLEINNIEVDLGDPDWSNPINIYLWGVPNTSVYDPYNIVDNDYRVPIKLTAKNLPNGKSITLDNVNLEGCYETVPEPATLTLFGVGLFGIFLGKNRKTNINIG